MASGFLRGAFSLAIALLSLNLAPPIEAKIATVSSLPPRSNFPNYQVAVLGRRLGGLAPMGLVFHLRCEASRAGRERRS
jgi:hypothetical protein